MIYEIQNKTQSGRMETPSEFALSLQSAHDSLLKRGYVCTQDYSDTDNNAGTYEFAGNDFFVPQSARIISHKTID